MVAGVKGRARKKVPALLDALGKGLDEGAKPLVVLLRDLLDTVEWSLADLERRILDAVARDYELPWTLLQTLPGTGPLAAAALLAEVGDAFGTARRLSSCAGMCPGNHESAGESRGGKRRKGNVYLRRNPVRDCPRGGAHARRAVWTVQTASHEATRHRPGGRGDGAQDPAHRLRDAPRRRAVPRPADRHQARTARRNKARWLKMLHKANLLQEVARAAAKQLRSEPDGTGTGTPAAPISAPEPVTA